MNESCPSEEAEEITLSEYCESRGFTHWHIPNETWTSSWKQKIKNKAMGVKSGPSDHWMRVKLPRPDGSRRYALLVIELKRLFGNTPTDAQIKFIKDMEEIDNITAVCCYGADEAIKVIEELEAGVFTTFDFCWERMLKIEENRKNKPKKTKKSEKIEKSKNDLPY